MNTIRQSDVQNLVHKRIPHPPHSYLPSSILLASEGHLARSREPRSVACEDNDPFASCM